MRFAARFLLFTLCCLVAANLASAARAADLTLDSSNGFVIPAEINGQAVRLRVDISAPGYILLNPEVARRAGLNGSMVRARTLVGPFTLNGGSNGTRVNVAGVQLRERVAWFDRDVAEGADGTISPELLPYDTITYRLGPQRSDDRPAEVVLSYSKGAGLALPMRTAAGTVAVDFSLVRPRSLATAAAGALISSLQGGSWSGEPQSQVISFGIERPVREMRLERPLRLAGLALDRLWVRTGDHRGNYALPTDAPADPGEIVVTAQPNSRQRAVLSLTIGLDELGLCSSVVYRKADRRLRLDCAN